MVVLKELEKYAESLVNSNNDEASTYSRNVYTKIENNKIFVVFNSPTSFKLNEELYFKIYDVLNVPMFPILTLIPQEKMIVEEFSSNDISTKRAFAYPFRVGVPKRKIFQNYFQFENSFLNNNFELMTGVNFNMKNLTSIAIASTSGGGKSYLIHQFLIYFKKIGCELIIVDGKKDLPAKFAKKHNLKLITNEANKSDDNILNNICEELSSLNDIIVKRQNLLFDNKLKEEELKPIVIVFDEIGTLTNLASKNVKETFFKLLTRVMTLGRQAKVHVLLSSQRLDANTIPTICKEQCNCLIQLGSLSSNNLQYLFPDFKNFSILTPRDRIGNKGRGIISINQELHSFMVPTILEVA